MLTIVGVDVPVSGVVDVVVVAVVGTVTTGGAEVVVASSVSVLAPPPRVEVTPSETCAVHCEFVQQAWKPLTI